MLLKLKDRRHRDQTGRYLIEGTKEVLRALEAQVPLEAAYLCPELLRPEGKALLEKLKVVPQVEVSRAVFERLSLRQNPDGMLGLAQMNPKRLESLTFAENPLVLIIDGLEKPGNIGALLRTADAARLDAIFLTGEGTDLYNPNVIRASLGSVFSRPVIAVKDELLKAFLEHHHFKLIAATPATSQTYWHEDYRSASAILLGTEHEGLRPFWLEAATSQVSIPMAGLADSLNVATAGALLIYEALRQRQQF